MSKKILLLTLCAAAMISNLACGTDETANTNAANMNPNVNIAIDPKNMPPGFENTNVAIDPKNMPPGFENANVSIDPKNLPPGINPNAGKTPMPKNTPPIPGIPSEEELKKQRNQPPSNQTAPPPPAADTDADKSPNSPTDRQRTIKKP